MKESYSTILQEAMAEVKKQKEMEQTLRSINKMCKTLSDTATCFRNISREIRRAEKGYYEY